MASATAATTRFPRLQFRGGLPGDPPEHRRGEQAIARQIAGRLRAGDADRRAAGREQVGKRPAVLSAARAPCVSIASPPCVWNSAPVTLMAQNGAASFFSNTRPKRSGLPSSIASSSACSASAGTPMRAASASIDIRPDQRARLLGVLEILELPRHARDARIENVERDSARLAQHLAPRLRNSRAPRWRSGGRRG